MTSVATPQPNPSTANSKAGTPPKGRRLLLITPVRNEEAYLQRTIDSLAKQTVHPVNWVIVDDGSTDDTPNIATRAAEQYDWIELHRRADSGTRKVGGGVVEAFNDGLALHTLADYDSVCKLDGDLELEPVYFERLFEKFEANPRLGTASGKCWLVTEEGLQLERTHDDFSLGAAKLYRVDCFRDIGGFVVEVMWDGIDCHRCRMLGWQAASFHDEDLKIRHLRRMGSSHHNIIRGRLRWGFGQYFMGTHPLYMLAITTYRLFERPWIIGGLMIGTGYFGAWLRRRPQYGDQDFRRFLHRWQLARLGIGSKPAQR